MGDADFTSTCNWVPRSPWAVSIALWRPVNSFSNGPAATTGNIHPLARIRGTARTPVANRKFDSWTPARKRRRSARTPKLGGQIGLMRGHLDPFGFRPCYHGNRSKFKDLRQHTERFLPATFGRVRKLILQLIQGGQQIVESVQHQESAGLLESAGGKNSIVGMVLDYRTHPSRPLFRSSKTPSSCPWCRSPRRERFAGNWESGVGFCCRRDPASPSCRDLD